MQDHAIVIADQNGVIQHWSEGASTLIGYSRDEAVGQRLDLVVPPDMREQHWHGFGNAMKGGAVNSAGVFFDLPVRCRGGETKTLRGQLHILRSESNGPIGAMAILTSPA
ncbi:MAG TPA: PAS domain S-box protein [Pseudolabrys sp.]|nr:PAS domain S-box protein [Pseudolabrys sp.]